MMKTFALASVAVAALAASTAANATAVYVIDDFLTSPPNPFTATLTAAGQSAQDGPEDYTIGGLAYNRTLLFQNIADTNPAPGAAGGAYLSSANGELKIVNAQNVRSRLTLTYNIASLDTLIPDTSSVQLGVTFSNGLSTINGPTQIDAYIGDGTTMTALGSLILTQRIDGTTPELWSNMQLLGSQLTSTNKYLTFIVNGPTDYDLTIDQIQAAVGTTVAGDVPEPAMIGLFGLGALGLGIARRRKR